MYTSCNMATCVSCRATLAGAARCPSCGAAVPGAGLLALELPSAATPAPPPAAPERPRRRPPTSRRAAPPVPSGPHRAVAVTLPRADRMDLPELCACCGGEAGEQRLESRKGTIHGFPQELTLRVPYCAACVRHQRRPAWRAALWLLAAAAGVAAYAKLVPVVPDPPILFAVPALAILAAARGLSYVLLPRFGRLRTHAREGRALWIRRFDAASATLVACHAGYADALAAGGAAGGRPRVRVRSLRRGISALLFGSDAEIAALPPLSLLRPLATAALLAALVWHLKPIPADERAFLAFQARPSVGAAQLFAKQFRSSKRLPEVERRCWELALAAGDRYSVQTYLKAFPKGRDRDAAETLLGELAFKALEKAPGRAAALAFLRENPASPRLKDARRILLDALDEPASARSAPPLSVLRGIFEAASDGKIPVRIEGFSEKPYRDAMAARLKEALQELGLAPAWVKEDAVIEVDGKNGLNTGLSYSKYPFGNNGPYGEVVEARIVVRLREGPPAWSARFEARSPARVTYTSFSGFDDGPSQWDVRSQTVPEFAKALAVLFSYP